METKLAQILEQGHSLNEQYITNHVDIDVDEVFEVARIRRANNHELAEITCTNCMITAGAIRQQLGGNKDWRQVSVEEAIKIPVFQIVFYSSDDAMSKEHVSTIWDNKLLQSRHMKYPLRCVDIDREQVLGKLSDPRGLWHLLLQEDDPESARYYPVLYASV